jgi:alpha-tubulin suppressor-like RCC1 family protein
MPLGVSMPREADTHSAPVNPTGRRGRICWPRLLPGPCLITLLLAAVGCGEDTPSPTDPGPTAALATAAEAPAFYQVSGGGFHSCGVTTDQRAYCWGYNGSGALGTGTESGPETCIGAVGPFACSTRPAPVAGTRRFRQISAGNVHSCAVATDNRAYCWGSNSFGALGDGTRTERLRPALVRGGLHFRQVNAGLHHTCGVSDSDQRVYCWGDNGFGQLGDGTITPRLSPVPALGGRKFRQVSAGNWHTCGVTTSNEAYCWGRDAVGQLGNDPQKARRTKPVLVAGGHQFRQVDAGSNHTCGVTTINRAFCWGNGGQIGDGQTQNRFTPRAVAGGLSFDRVTAGGFHTCGETTTNQAYCWGNNSFGQLGDGGPAGTDQLSPVAVAGGLEFAQLSTGGSHTCGKTPSSIGYCWGDDFFGQLGHGDSGSEAESRTPVAVDGGT